MLRLQGEVEMKAVVTGAGGFVGRVLLDRLEADESTEIIALTRRDTNDKSSKQRLKWMTTDYSRSELEALLIGADVVFHLAGTKGSETDMSDFETDREMMKNILAAMKTDGVKKMVYASSRMVYGNPDKIPWTEDMVPEPKTAYGKNKVICEDMCKAAEEDFGMKYAIVRIAQVLGIGEGTRTMINVFQDIAREKGEITVIGKSIAKRQYIYTKDLAEIMYRLATDDTDESVIINAGMLKAYSNLEIAQAINAIFKNDTAINYNDSEPETIQSSMMDVNLMLKKTGYVPMNMEQALEDMY